MLGVFLKPAFICLGHECQVVYSPCDGMHAYRLGLGLYLHVNMLRVAGPVDKLSIYLSHSLADRCWACF